MSKPTLRNILLAVAGQTPATVTEAVYALAVQRKVPLEEVVVLTTSGARASLEQALGEVMGIMRKDFPRALAKTKLSVRAIKLDDVRSSEDNDQMADWILDQVHGLTQNSETALHASLAGGRKTMSYYLGTAMELLARPQDRLYHVLVSPEFEVPGFFYPAPAKSPLQTVTIRNSPRPTSQAVVDLAEVPFVLLRDQLSGLMPASGKRPSFHALVSRVRDTLGNEFLPVQVTFGAEDATILFGESPKNGVRIHYQSAGNKECLVYTWLLWRKSRGIETIALTDAAAFEQHWKEFVDWQKKVAPAAVDQQLVSLIDEWRHPVEPKSFDPTEFLQKAWYAGYFSPHTSRLSKKLEREFNKQFPARDPRKYFIQLRERGVWGIAIPPENISFRFPRGARD